jgi:hypothetical protein
MVDAVIERQLVACLANLPLAAQRQVLAFAQTLQAPSPKGVLGSVLVTFAGVIDASDLAKMSVAIDADCERIDASEW